MHPDLVAAAHPDRLALVTDDGEQRTYAQLAAAAWRIARLLRDRGLRPGDHLALCMSNSPEMLEVLWGAHNAGLLYTACSTRSTADELAHIVDDCDAAVLVVTADVADRAEAVVGRTSQVRHRFAVGGPVAGHESLSDAVAGQPSTPLEGAVAGLPMLYSSGTTGLPKGIRPSIALRPLHEPELYTEAMRRLLDIAEDDVYLSPAPLYHTAPLRACMSMHRIGGAVVLMRRFDARRTLELIEEHRVTHGQFVPTMFHRILRLDADTRERHDLTSLKAVVHSSAPCLPEVKRRMIDWWGPVINEYYGGTEGCGATWVTSEDWLEHPGTVGRATIGTIHVVGEDGRELPAGETGTIFFSDGPQFEYHKDPERTAEAHDHRGWATYGDVGRVDEDGYLFLSDRRAHMVISGGVNVYPQEAENALGAHPLVVDVAVFGIPDEDLGERVVAVVEPVEMPADDAAARALEATLVAHCRERLASVKCPRSIDFRAELPRHDTGKLLKRLLVDEYAGR